MKKCTEGPVVVGVGVRGRNVLTRRIQHGRTPLIMRETKVDFRGLSMDCGDQTSMGYSVVHSFRTEVLEVLERSYVGEEVVGTDPGPVGVESVFMSVTED